MLVYGTDRVEARGWRWWSSASWPRSWRWFTTYSSPSRQSYLVNPNYITFLPFLVEIISSLTSSTFSFPSNECLSHSISQSMAVLFTSWNILFKNLDRQSTSKSLLPQGNLSLQDSLTNGQLLLWELKALNDQTSDGQNSEIGQIWIWSEKAT